MALKDEVEKQVNELLKQGIIRKSNSPYNSPIWIVPNKMDASNEKTTDTSNYAIGAVLEQDKKPLMFLSRTLNKTEENYATNEKELLAIVWALENLNNLLYCAKYLQTINH